MRIVLLLWGFPIVFFWGWYFLSLNDMNFGMFFLSKPFHDHLFNIYGKILHMDAANVPAALAWIFFVDTLIVLAIALIGKYRRFWWPHVKQFFKTYILRRSPDDSADTRDVIEVAVRPTHPAE